MQVPARSYVRFADFALDMTTGELRSNGNSTFLQEKPFQILTLLLERPGQLITRDELVKQLWADGTFVDFDQSLNKAVNRLREALGDSAEHPKFIETLPRRGYRFIAPVEPLVEDSPNRESRGTTRNPQRKAPRSTRVMIPACALGLIIGCWLVWRIAWRDHTAGMIRSIAVLPLENLSGDAAQDYFADGMTDELITNLGQIGSIRVISRTSIMQYKGVRKPMPQIARELDVDAVVEGTVLRSGEQVRITAQLIQARTDQHLWTNSYQGDIRDVLGLQSQVASAIASEILIKLTPQQKAALKSSRVVNPDAYEAYLRALPLAQRRTVDGLRQSIEYFEHAVAKEPNYAEAHAGLASAYIALGHMVALPPQQAFPRAKTEALKALEVDEALAEAHESLATVRFLYDWDFPGAETEFQRAILLNPNSTDAHEGYSDFLVAMGRPDEAIAERVRNRQIDPLSLSAIVGIGWEQYLAGRYDLAIENASSVLAVDPNNYRARLCLGLSLEQKRQFSAAILELQKATNLSNDNVWIDFVAHAKALAGDKLGAQKILADLLALSRRTYVSPWCFAMMYAGLGDKEQSFIWLEKSYEGREHDLAFSKVWPMFDSLRSDPRYKDLMHRVGLPQ
jgi:TolB-like protein/DNA-binding winged helix-turn-helix (wHTH) protein/Tfp pilus assembly protein PilF